MSHADARNFVFFALGIATMWLPIHYSFYRYSLVGEGPYYVAALAVMLACCCAGIACRARLTAWLAHRPPFVLGVSVLSLASNGLLVGLPYLPVSGLAAQALHYAAVALYAAVFTLLFFAWIERMSDVMFQMPIVTVVGGIGAGIVSVFLLVNAFYGTVVYQAASMVCLAVSGACWQACRFDAVQSEGGKAFLPTGRTLREWSLLLVAFALVTLLHAVTFAGGGQSAEQSAGPTWLLHAGLVVFLAMFVGLILLGTLRGVSSRAAFALFTAMASMLYEGLLIAMAAPDVLSEGGHLAMLTVVSRTLRVFIFLVLMTMCYRDSVSAISTFGLLFLLVEILGAIVCYVMAPVAFETSGVDPAALRIPMSSSTALLLSVVFAAFLAVRIAGPDGVAAPQGAGMLGNVSDRGVRETQGLPVGPSHETGRDGGVDFAQSGAAPSRRGRCEEMGGKFGLTERESDIMYYLSLGFSVKKIAEILCISANTVSTHSSRLYRKVGVHSRQELIDAVDRYASRG